MVALEHIEQAMNRDEVINSLGKYEWSDIEFKEGS